MHKLIIPNNKSDDGDTVIFFPDLKSILDNLHNYVSPDNWQSIVIKSNDDFFKITLGGLFNRTVFGYTNLPSNVILKIGFINQYILYPKNNFNKKIKLDEGEFLDEIKKININTLNYHYVIEHNIINKEGYAVYATRLYFVKTGEETGYFLNPHFRLLSLD